jgi:cell division protein FtsZ
MPNELGLKMIEITRSYEAHSDWRVKAVGIGGAGTHAVDRLTRDGFSNVELIAANTDLRALSTSVTADRIVLGQGLTRGLGAGGDPDLGRAAALESIAQVGERLMGASLVLLLVGLGGGTGSGAAPCIAQIAREQGSQVAVLATLPFSFEGRRRRDQALEALELLRKHADLVICFENDRMPTVTDPSSGIEDAFAAVDSLLAQSVRALVAMTRRRNVMHSGLDEIAATVSEPGSSALFGYGIAEGEERARAALMQAFANPLLDAGGALQSVSRLWVYIAGGPDVRWSEVQTLMGELTERTPSEVRLYFGAAVDPSLAGSISVTLLAGLPGFPVVTESPASQSKAIIPKSFSSAPEPSRMAPAPAVTPPQAEPESHGGGRDQFIEPVSLESAERLPRSQPDLQPEAAEDQGNSQPVPAVAVRQTPVPPYELSKERRREAAILATSQQEMPPASDAYPDESILVADSLNKPAEDEPSFFSAPDAAPDPEPQFELRPSKSEPPAAPEAETLANRDGAGRRSKDNVQEQMRFEAPNRGGRFEKTDPTIVDGEDLDVPTFMRQRLPLE